MDVSSHVKAIEQNANNIAQLIKGNLALIANDLRELLGDLDYDRIVQTPAIPQLERANDLVQCVLTQIKQDAMQYQVFYSAIAKHRNLQGLLRKLPKPDGESRSATLQFPFVHAWTYVSRCVILTARLLFAM